MRYTAAPAPCAAVGPMDLASAVSRRTAATPALRARSPSSALRMANRSALLASWPNLRLAGAGPQAPL
eukprot:28133-Lingulodinium_polyedra.AAC.1